MKRPFIIACWHLQEDSWTYGDWKQYVAFINDHTAVCCRASLAPTIWGSIGFSILLAILLIVINMPHSMIDWVNLAIITFVGFALLGPAFIELVTPWRWMVPVDRPFKGSNGTFDRRDYVD